MENVGIVAYVFIIVFCIVLVISWIILPFAIFGIKKRLDEIISIMRR